MWAGQCRREGLLVCAVCDDDLPDDWNIDKV
jgi:hypothetical protein